MLKPAAPPRVPRRSMDTPSLVQQKNYTPFRRLATHYVQCMTTSTDLNSCRPYHVYKSVDRIHHIFNEDTGKKESIDSLRQGKHKHILETALSREWGRLAMGTLENPTGTDTIEFIYHTEAPGDCDVTYAMPHLCVITDHSKTILIGHKLLWVEINLPTITTQHYQQLRCWKPKLFSTAPSRNFLRLTSKIIFYLPPCIAQNI